MRIFFLLSVLIILLVASCKKDSPSPDASCPDCPSITTLTPNFGSPGDTITITGKNFAGLQRVQFGTEEAEILDGATATIIKVIAPDLNKTGAVDVIVVRNFQAPSGGTAVLNSEAVAFTYAPEKATISSLTPKNGTAGTVVTILGQRFTNVKAVRFNGVDAVIQTQTPTQLVVAAPTVSVTGLVEVVVVTQFDLNGTLKENLSAPTSFTYDGNFGILDFSPKIGKKDDLVTISGFGFGTNTAAIQVQFNGKVAEVVSVTDSEIKAKVPIKAGDGKIRVVKGGSNILSNGNFEYTYNYFVTTIFNDTVASDIDYYRFNASTEVYYIANGADFFYKIVNGVVTSIPPPIGGDQIKGGGIVGAGNYLGSNFDAVYRISIYQNFFQFLYSNGPDYAWDIKELGDELYYTTTGGITPTLASFNKTSGITKLFVDESSSNYVGTIPVNSPVNLVGFDFVSEDTIFFADGYTIRSIINDNVSIVAGNQSVGGYLDGNFSTALFAGLRPGLVYWGEGIIFVTDWGNNCIRRLDLKKSKVTTIAGTLVPGFQNGIGTDARFKNPFSMTKDSDGNLIIGDGNNAIRKITIE